MTWPPPNVPLPTDALNATPQFDRHADDHNTTNQTINDDLVPQIDANRTGHIGNTIRLNALPSGVIASSDPTQSHDGTESEIDFSGTGATIYGDGWSITGIGTFNCLKTGMYSISMRASMPNSAGLVGSVSYIRDGTQLQQAVTQRQTGLAYDLITFTINDYINNGEQIWFGAYFDGAGTTAYPNCKFFVGIGRLFAAEA